MIHPYNPTTIAATGGLLSAHRATMLGEITINGSTAKHAAGYCLDAPDLMSAGGMAWNDLLCAPQGLHAERGVA